MEPTTAQDKFNLRLIYVYIYIYVHRIVSCLPVDRTGSIGRINQLIHVQKIKVTLHYGLPPGQDMPTDFGNFSSWKLSNP